MCYNCGCQMPDNDMGNPKNITTKTFEEAAKASNQTVEEAMKNTHELLHRELGIKDHTHEHGQEHSHTH